MTIRLARTLEPLHNQPMLSTSSGRCNAHSSNGLYEINEHRSPANPKLSSMFAIAVRPRLTIPGERSVAARKKGSQMPINSKYLFVASMDVDPDKEDFFNEIFC